jgi:hypothetical protein
MRRKPVRRTTTYLLTLLALTILWPVAGCHDHREKRSVTIEGPNSKTEVEIEHEKD